MSFKLMTNRATDYDVLEADWDALTDNFAAIDGWFEIPLFPRSTGMVPSSGLQGAGFAIQQSAGAGTHKPQWKILSFDKDTDEGRIWDFLVPRMFGYTVVLAGSFYCVAATSGNVRLGIELAAISDTDTAVDAKVFDAATLSTIAVPAVAKKEKNFLISIADADADAMAAIDRGNACFYRDADDAGNDTLAEDMNLTRLSLFFNVANATV